MECSQISRGIAQSQTPSIQGPMELQLIIAFLIFVFMALKIAKGKANPSPTPPPGPWKLPIIGSLHHFLWGSPLPHRRLCELARKHGPLMHLQLGQVSTIIVSSPTLAKEITRTNDIILASRPEIRLAKSFTYGRTELFFAPYGEYWRMQRKICMLGLLTNRRVESYRSIRQEEVSDLVKSVSSSLGSEINLTDMFSDMLTNIASRAVFGERCRHRNRFALAVKEVGRLLWENNTADFFPGFEFVTVVTGTMRRFRTAHQKLDGIIYEILEEYKRKERHEGEVENLVDMLLKLQEQGGLGFPLTDDNVKAMVTEMFAAGMETTSTTMVWVMSELIRNPDSMKKVHAEVRRVVGENGVVDEHAIGEMKYLKMAIKETLRLHPPVSLLLRESREIFEIDGYEIPTKTRVIVNAWAIGRDPQYWAEPELFKPERFHDDLLDFNGTDLKYIPFGAGRRICPGTSFGLANVELALAQLLYSFNWEIPNGGSPKDFDMMDALGISIHRKSPLRLMPTAGVHFGARSG